MRQAGILSNREQAQRLADYLLTLGINARVDADGAGWAVWIRDEDQLPQATKELNEFLADPGAARYQSAASTAAALRQQKDREDRERRKNFIEVSHRWQVAAGGRRPATIVLIGVSVLITLATNFAKDRTPFLNAMWFQPPPRTELELREWTPTGDIDRGEIWRLVTPIFIHMSPLHLFFDMYVFYLFGSMIETRRGTLKFVLLVLALAATSNYGQSFFEFQTARMPTAPFGGMSGVAYGLFGYLWMKTRFDPTLQLFLPPNIIIWLLGWYVLCWTGIFGPVANWAHTVGLVVGVVIGYAPVAWRQMQR